MRSGVTYDPNASLFSVAFRWKGTLLPMVLQKPMFWILMVMMVIVLSYHDYLLVNGGDGLPVLEWDAAVVRRGCARGHTSHWLLL